MSSPEQNVKLRPMQDVVYSVSAGRQKRSLLARRIRVEAPTIGECGLALFSSVLLILSFPDFGFWPLAWVALVPLLVITATRPRPWHSFALGWLAGTIFFYGSCYWLTYSMVHFGGIPAWAAYLLLIPGALIVGLFPAIFALVLACALHRWRNKALYLAPIIWTATEWARLEVTGQLWNAIGYSQAYYPILVQPARWGGVYAVGFLVVTTNAAITFAFLNRCIRALKISAAVIAIVVLLIAGANLSSWSRTNQTIRSPALSVVAVQPNVPMDPSVSSTETERLTWWHISESEKALRELPLDPPRIVIWPESPMNFTYGSDAQFRDLLAAFTRENHTALLFNSQEAAPAKGSYNSALLVNDEGRAIAQYDKIRLLPFGEYVPLPRWLPGASLIRAIVGDFTAGQKYTLIPAGPVRLAVFICIESAYPSIARTFTAEGADVLINISNDGYLGPTAVMRQHLANAIFRAVENGRPLLRVTNSGITAYITAAGEVRDATAGFQTAIRKWTINAAPNERTFYTNYGDVLAWLSAIITGLVFVLTLPIFHKEVRG